MKRALIIRTGAVGDVILTLPVLAALKNRYPEIRIDVWGNADHLSLLEAGGYAETVFSIDDRATASLFVKGGQPSTAIRSMLANYDLILSYLPDVDGVFTDHLKCISPARIITGRARPPIHQRTHMSLILMDVLKPLGIEPLHPPSLPHLPFSANIQPADCPCIAVHPGSGNRQKCWPVERYTHLIQKLNDLGYRLILTAGPADVETVEALLELVDEDEVCILKNRTLTEVGGMLKSCRAMVGNDTGITHLAAALGTPTLALFGPTDPAVWGPRGPYVHIMHGGARIEQDVAGKRWPMPFTERPLTEISPEHVLTALQLLLR